MGKWNKGKRKQQTPSQSQISSRSPSPSRYSASAVPQHYANANIERILQLAQINANEVVIDARKERTKKLKTAHAEADKDVLKHRNEKDKEFLKIEEELEDKMEMITKKIDGETNAQIDVLAGSANQKKIDLVKQLVRMVCNIKPSVHPNFLLMKSANALDN
ncbi:unnamed protein product [Brassicogethes aeneus]|uniref:V-type proton ATPase subunit G n=1 Tax=Brassicogethes aeneus TaxID=1431903 RepID=A0A9P0FNC3_BRAAE|nr:unnamed protein product [Brassicogethes aeneus]